MKSAANISRIFLMNVFLQDLHITLIVNKGYIL